jgi:hypothetical protein
MPELVFHLSWVLISSSSFSASGGTGAELEASRFSDWPPKQAASTLILPTPGLRWSYDGQPDLPSDGHTDLPRDGQCNYLA